MLTKKEAAIITIYTGVLIGEFSEAHKYAEELAGRPVFTHDFARKEFNEFLHEKAKKDFISIPVGDDLAEENARLNEQLSSLTGANDELRDHITAIEFERACLMAEIDKLKGR